MWYYSYIQRLPTPENQYMIRGSRLHKQCEDYLNDKLPEVPYEVKRAKKMLEELKLRKGIAERTWLVDKQWNPVVESRLAWLKAIVDVHFVEEDVLFLHDFKSGREYPGHREQLELYGLMGLQVYPDVKRCEFSAMYIDNGYSSNDGAILRGVLADAKRQSWTNKALALMQDVTYTPSPSTLKCGRCAYSKKNGGPCDAGV